MGKYKAILSQKIETLKETGAFHVIVGSFMTKFASFFGSIFIVRLLTKSEYGILSYYENFMGYFFIFAVDCGHHTAILVKENLRRVDVPFDEYLFYLLRLYVWVEH